MLTHYHVLGFKVTERNGEIVRGESKLPEIIPGLSVKLIGLGGTPGTVRQTYGNW